METEDKKTVFLHIPSGFPGIRDIDGSTPVIKDLSALLFLVFDSGVSVQLDKNPNNLSDCYELYCVPKTEIVARTVFHALKNA